MKRRDSKIQNLSLKKNSSDIKTNIFKSCQTTNTHMILESENLECHNWTEIMYTRYYKVYKLREFFWVKIDNLL